MSSDQSFFPWAAGGLTAFALVLAIFFTTDFAAAAEPSFRATSNNCRCTTPYRSANSVDARSSKSPKLSLADEISALESLRIALNEVADGARFIWHSNNGHLSGVVNPVSSFKNADGAICRHLVVVFSSAYDTRKTETVACRQSDGVWQLDG